MTITELPSMAAHELNSYAAALRSQLDAVEAEQHRRRCKPGWEYVETEPDEDADDGGGWLFNPHGAACWMRRHP